MSNLIKYPNCGMQLLIVACRDCFHMVSGLIYTMKLKCCIYLTNKVYNYIMHSAYFELTKINIMHIIKRNQKIQSK